MEAGADPKIKGANGKYAFDTESESCQDILRRAIVCGKHSIAIAAMLTIKPRCCCCDSPRLALALLLGLSTPEIGNGG